MGARVPLCSCCSGNSPQGDASKVRRYSCADPAQSAGNHPVPSAGKPPGESVDLTTQTAGKPPGRLPSPCDGSTANRRESAGNPPGIRRESAGNPPAGVLNRRVQTRRNLPGNRRVDYHLKCRESAGQGQHTFRRANGDIGFIRIRFMGFNNIHSPNSFSCQFLNLWRYVYMI